MKSGRFSPRFIDARYHGLSWCLDRVIEEASGAKQDGKYGRQGQVTDSAKRAEGTMVSDTTMGFRPEGRREGIPEGRREGNVAMSY